MKKADKTVSLYALVEAMQRSLENRGLDPVLVDMTITRWIASLASPGERRRSASIPWRVVPQV